MENLGHDILLGTVTADSIALSLQNEFILAQQQNKIKQSTILFKPKTTKGAYSLPAALTLCTANYLISYPNNINNLLEMYTICIQKGYWITDNSHWDNLPFALKNTLKSFQETKNWKKVKVNNYKTTLNIASFLPIIPTIIAKSKNERSKILAQYLCPFTREETDVLAIQVLADFLYNLIQFKDKHFAYYQLQEACHQLVEKEYYQFNCLINKHTNCITLSYENESLQNCRKFSLTI